MSRRVIQVLVWQDELVALCDDGALFGHGSEGWHRLESIPGTDDDPMFSEVQPAPDSGADWPPLFLKSPTLRLYAWSHDLLTELTDSNGLILAARTDCAIIEAIDGVDALRGAHQEFASFRKKSHTYKGIPFSYWSDTIPF